MEGFDEYKEIDVKKRNLYERYYGKQFINKLNDRSVLFNKSELLLKKNEWIGSLDNNMPNISKYKPFIYHLKRAQYGFIYKKIQTTSQFKLPNQNLFITIFVAQ